ncbi:MAG TPA: SGNH/GDSL hydrolase family protein [Chloroflexia bacterium]|nr:SGNH/GDSL hydrolase family protein [Chloroflexia bacterium]
MPHHPAHRRSPPAATDSRPVAEPLPVAAGQRLLCLGDSITAATPGYVDILEQAVGHARRDLALQWIKAGVSGNTIRDLEARLDRDVLAQHPTWVTICIGTNDSIGAARGQPSGVPLPEFEARYAVLLARLRAAAITPILLTIPVVGSDAPDSPIPDPQPYNAAIRALATREQLRLVDLYQAFYDVYARAAAYKQIVSLSTDGIHPNSPGHTLIARTIILQLGLLQR